jgi:RND family efflux transporter MFP subunit
MSLHWLRGPVPWLGSLALLGAPALFTVHGAAPGRVVLEVAGYIVPARQVTVSPQVPGVVVKLPIVEGRAVKAGDVLAELAREEYLFALRRAEARLALALARHAKAKAGGNKEDVAVAQAEVELARADVDRCRWRLDATVIRSPISGVILTKKTEEGNLVNPLGFNVSASICDIADLSQVEVDVAIPERDIGKVKAGQDCLVRADANPDKVYKGRVDRLLPVADRAKGTVSVRVQLLDLKRDAPLRPESRAVVQFLAAK